MLDKVVQFLAKIIVGKQLVGIVAVGNNKLSGMRTELLLACAAVVLVLKVFGVVDEATSSLILSPILGALPVTLAEKFSRAKATVEALVPAPPAPPSAPA